MRFVGVDPTASSAEVTAVASGALASGDAVIVNSDGTVSVVAPTGPELLASGTFDASTDVRDSTVVYDPSQQKVVVFYADGGGLYGTAVVGTVVGNSITFGSPVVFSSSYTQRIAAAYSPVDNKIVVAYQDSGSSAYGRAKVATVSGSSISFGSITTFYGGVIYSDTDVVYDSVSQKFLFTYDMSTNIRVKVGTLSGTTLSYGAEYNVTTSTASSSATLSVDATQQKCIIACRDSADSNRGRARVITISGTSVTFGTLTRFTANTVSDLSAIYDSANQKVVIFYSDNSNGSYGTAVVGTISGTSVSFGTPVVFSSVASYYIAASYDNINEKCVVSYATSSSLAKSSVGTVSGTSISFDTSATINSGATGYISSAFDPDSGKVVITYEDDGDSSKGNYSLLVPAGTTLTSSNFIGFSKKSYSDTETATVQVACSVTDTQSGLVSGQKYYVTGDGTLSTTAGSPSVFAGTAVSSTKLIVKG